MSKTEILFGLACILAVGGIFAILNGYDGLGYLSCIVAIAFMWIIGRH